MFQNQSLERKQETTPAAVGSHALPIVAPRMDIYENDGAYQLAVEMPGAEQSSVNVVLEGGVLDIKGSTKVPSYGGYSMRYSEYRACQYQRRLHVGDNVDADHISAHLAAGILRVTLPKRAEARPRRIAVKSA